MISIVDAFILGIIEGFAEFLPISSTAHLILTSHLLSLQQTDEHILFEIVIQLGAILAVVVLFWKEFLSVARLKNLALAFIPTGIAGFLIYPYIKILFQTPVLIGITLLCGGIAILLVEKKYQRNIKEGAIQPLQTLTVKQSLLLGCYQALSILPGVSRSGAIIIGGLFHTMERKAVAQFAFLLAVPTMSIATAYSLLKNREILLEQSFTLPLFVGFLTSFVIAMMVITFLLNYIKKHSFVVFGWYRIFLGILIIGVFL